MAVNGARIYRPKYHYTPEKGWINDPNGLIYYKNRWHLFAQHFPDATKWGPMHWAHAVSDDLLNWERLPIALYPDDTGMCFSGSAAEINGRLCLMYTAHGDKERQCAAFSDDGVNFTKHPGNPVIENPGLRDFRDPKVFRNAVLGGYTVAVAAGDHVDFYHSLDLVKWRKTGEFSDQARVSGIHECPDVFQMPGGKWVMIASMILPGGGNRTQYVTGEFDGMTFASDRAFSAPEWIDAGWENYAPVTFFDAPRTLMLGWANCWTYADRLPMGAYAGMMTLARELSLVKTPGGEFLAQTPVIDAVTGEYRNTRAITSERFRAKARASGDFKLKFTSEAGEYLEIYALADEIIIDRRNAGERGEAPELADEKFGIIKARRKIAGDIEIDIVFDSCIAEVFADGGLFTATAQVFPTAPYSAITTENCEVSVAELK